MLHHRELATLHSVQQDSSATQPSTPHSETTTTASVSHFVTEPDKSAKPQVNQVQQPINKPEPIKIAVIGDVTTDWAFISKEPARPRFPVIKPWTRDPATHLFAFPGGAWFSGHVIQGALAEPFFTRLHRATIHHNRTGLATHITLTGQLSTPKASERTSEITLTLLDSSAIDIIVNDDTEPDVTNLRAVHVIISHERHDRPLHIDAGLVNAIIRCDKETEPTPGHFTVEQVGRYFYVEHSTIEFTEGELPLTFLALSNATLTVTLIIGPKDKYTFDHKVTSLRIVPKNMRRHGTPEKHSLLLSTSHKHLRVKTASLDVTYGSLVGRTTLADKGKLTAPEQPTTEVSTDLKLTLQSTQFPETHTSPYKLWQYTAPGRAVTMQSAAQIVHTLSEISLFKRYSHQRTAQRVYRRLTNHGVDGPDYGYPTILLQYDPTTYTNIVQKKVTRIGLPSSEPAIEMEIQRERPTEDDWASTPDRPRLVVIDDAGLGFSSRCDMWLPFLLSGTAMQTSSAGVCRSTFKQMRKHIAEEKKEHEVRSYIQKTWFIVKASHWLDSNQSALFDFLAEYEGVRRTVLVVSGESLRMGLANFPDKPGIKLAKTVSWERTVEDFVSALNGKSLEGLKQCRHMVVRLGLDGAIYCHNPSSVERKVSLWFAPDHIEGEYGDQLGDFAGLTTVLTAAIARDLTRVLVDVTDANDDVIAKAIDDSVRRGMCAVRRYFDMGYGPSTETVRKFERLQLPLSQVFSFGRIRGMRDEGQHRFVRCRVRGITGGGLPENWSILKQYIEGRSIAEACDNARRQNIRRTDDFVTAKSQLRTPSHAHALVCAIRAVSLGRNIVLHGVEEAFERFAEPFPYTQIGDLVAVDRREIEGLRSIRNLLVEYERHREIKTPISVAVFGPPGSGKSFAVKQIARHVMRDRIREFIFNLAQFSSFAELTRQLLQVRDAMLDNKIPLVFFDEFDSPYSGVPLGWLKFFLSPMQDGRFQHENTTLGIGKAILVFAGGIASSHEEFKDPLFWEAERRQQSAERGRPKVFREAKGPDFHSRLRGFLNILGPNPYLKILPRRASQNVRRRFDRFAREDFTFVIRRAVLVRRIIEEMEKGTIKGLLDSERYAEVDRDVLDAVLLTDRYRHGVRSLHAIFEMSTVLQEGALTKTALPSRDQLLMHVDESFYDILVRDYTHLGSHILAALFEYDRRVGGIGEFIDGA